MLLLFYHHFTTNNSSLLILRYVSPYGDPCRHKDCFPFSAILSVLLPPSLISTKSFPVPATSVDSVNSFPESARVGQLIHKNQSGFDKLFYFSCWWCMLTPIPMDCKSFLDLSLKGFKYRKRNKKKDTGRE